MNNVNDTYFSGHYKQIWKTIIPDELTVKEIDFMIPFFNLRNESHVLDLMCGYGRHALALARKGIPVTAVDNLGEYIEEIEETVVKEALPLEMIQKDVMHFSTTQKFDLAICMGNSLNFFNRDDTTSLLKNIFQCLKPGGYLLINSWSLTEIVSKNFREKSWSTIGDLKYLVDSKVLYRPSRIETESIIISPDGAAEVKKAIDYIFSINEFEAMLAEAGFELKEVYSIPGRKKFILGEPRAYIVASKN
jgi:2-polyprenyl-3-methyl-5-hydroxy-6-metoxy-1,4-benzoquinol methylase